MPTGIRKAAFLSPETGTCGVPREQGALGTVADHLTKPAAPAFRPVQSGPAQALDRGQTEDRRRTGESGEHFRLSERLMFWY